MPWKRIRQWKRFQLKRSPEKICLSFLRYLIILEQLEQIFFWKSLQICTRISIWRFLFWLNSFFDLSRNINFSKTVTVFNGYNCPCLYNHFFKILNWSFFSWCNHDSSGSHLWLVSILVSGTSPSARSPQAARSERETSRVYLGEKEGLDADILQEGCESGMTQHSATEGKNVREKKD